MSDVVLGRRGFIGAFAALIAAPAIVKVGSLMPIRGEKLLTLDDLAIGGSRSLLTVDMITREAVQLFVNSNVFIQSLNQQYDEEFQVEGAKIGTTLRIRLPNDYKIEDRNRLYINPIVEAQRCVTLVPDQADIVPIPLAVAAGAAAVVAKNPTVSRRFWASR